MDNSRIEWTDATWNPVRGCSRVSKGCENCYAERQAHRASGPGRAYEGLTVAGKHGPRWTGEIRLVPDLLEQPLRWRRPRRIFVNSMSDLFHPGVPDDFIRNVWRVMSDADHHVYQILTKRPERMAELSPWLGELPNVWLGVSAEDQTAWDERVPHLLDTVAAVRWVSAEPLLGPIGMGASAVSRDGLDWLVVGGESGPGARAIDEAWVRSLRNQCVTFGVPFFFKQWGNLVRRDGLTLYAASKKQHGRELDGRTWDELPGIHEESA